MNGFKSLPLDLQIEICCFLPGIEIFGSVGQVCHSMRKMVMSKRFYRRELWTPQDCFQIPLLDPCCSLGKCLTSIGRNHLAWWFIPYLRALSRHCEYRPASVSLSNTMEHYDLKSDMFLDRLNFCIGEEENLVFEICLGQKSSVATIWYFQTTPFDFVSLPNKWFSVCPSSPFSATISRWHLSLPDSKIVEMVSDWSQDLTHQVYLCLTFSTVGDCNAMNGVVTPFSGYGRFVRRGVHSITVPWNYSENEIKAFQLFPKGFG